MAINLKRDKLAGNHMKGYSDSDKRIRLDYSAPSGSEDSVSIEDKDGNVTTGKMLSAKTFEMTEDIVYDALGGKEISKTDTVKTAIAKIAARLSDQIDGGVVCDITSSNLTITEEENIIAEGMENQQDLNIESSNYMLTNRSEISSIKDTLANLSGAAVSIQGEALVVGMVCYRSSSNGAFYQASREVSECNGELFVVLESTNVINEDCVVTSARHYVDIGSFQRGDILYLGTGGLFTTTVPSTTGDIVRVIGYSEGDTVVFRPDNTWGVIA